ncbi:MAG: hypothetical protein Q8Q95_03595 [bacterium]|nr:hypothetical protein [bacterium]
MLWLLVVIHWIINHTILSTTASKFSHLSDIRQRHMNFYDIGDAKTDNEIADLGSQFPWTELKANWLHTSEQIWLLLLIGAIIYIPIALCEEWGRAWTVARAKKEAWVNLPDDPLPAITGTITTAVTPRHNQILKQAYIFTREFVTALIAELLGERMMIR